MKNGLNTQKMNSVRRKLFEMLLEIIDWKTVQKLYDIIACGLHFDTTLRICDEKYDDPWYLSIVLNTYNYYKHWTFRKMKNCHNVKTV